MLDPRGYASNHGGVWLPRRPSFQVGLSPLSSLVRCYRDAEERAQVLIAVLAKLLRRGRDEIRQDDLFRTRLSPQHASRVRHEHCHRASPIGTSAMEVPRAIQASRNRFNFAKHSGTR
jgi:hypothetical protein